MPTHWCKTIFLKHLHQFDLQGLVHFTDLAQQNRAIGTNMTISLEMKRLALSHNPPNPKGRGVLRGTQRLLFAHNLSRQRESSMISTLEILF